MAGKGGGEELTLTVQWSEVQAQEPGKLRSESCCLLALGDGQET